VGSLDVLNLSAAATTPGMTHPPLMSPRLMSPKNAGFGTMQNWTAQKPSVAGTNGVYLLTQYHHDPISSPSNRRMGIFKPQDEQQAQAGAFAMGHEIVLKEAAAYYMDHRGFAKVPKTKLICFEDIESERKKYGSFQSYVKNLGPAEDYSSSLFSTKDVHAIGLLDLRLFNTDRHMANMMVCQTLETNGQENGMSLVPIDHGLILPGYRSLSDAWFEWTWWKQAQIPFDEETLKYVREIDIQADCNMLRTIGLRRDFIMTYALCNYVVKCGVEKGKNLKELADFFQRSPKMPESPCQLEALINDTIEASKGTSQTEVLDLRKLDSNRFIKNFRLLLENYM